MRNTFAQDMLLAATSHYGLLVYTTPQAPHRITEMVARFYRLHNGLLSHQTIPTRILARRVMESINAEYPELAKRISLPAQYVDLLAKRANADDDQRAIYRVFAALRTWIEVETASLTTDPCYFDTLPETTA